MTHGRCRSFAAVAAALLLTGARLLGAQGTITGRVTNEAGQPLGNTRVIVVGGSSGATTSEDGRYTIRNLPAASLDLQAFHVGQQSLKRTVVVPATGSVTARLRAEGCGHPVAGDRDDGHGRAAKDRTRKRDLDPWRRRHEGRAELDESMSELLVAKAPGVQVLGSPVSGARRRFACAVFPRCRCPTHRSGSSTASGTTRTTRARQARTRSRCSTTSSPEEIEDIEIVKGPSAATLYGTAAANGVIVVTTKKGRAGSTKWGFTGETRTIDDRNPYQAQYANFGHKIGGTGASIRCQLYVMQTPQFSAAQGATCISDSLTSYNNLEDPAQTFIHLGKRQPVRRERERRERRGSVLRQLGPG